MAGFYGQAGTTVLPNGRNWVDSPPLSWRKVGFLSKSQGIRFVWFLVFNAAMVFVGLPAAYSQAQAQGPRVPTSLMANPPQSFVVSFTLARPGSTPATMVVNFYLIDTGAPTDFSRLVDTRTYTTPNNYTVNIALPADCYVPTGTGWEIFAIERSQTTYGTYSYSNSFAIFQNPPSLSYYAPNQDALITARSSTATVDTTDLDTTDTVYCQIFPANLGCATAQNCTYTISLDGQSPTANYALQNISHNTYLSPVVQSLGKLSAGQHSVRSTFSSSNASTVSISQTFNVVTAALIAVEQPSGQPLADGSSTVTLDPVAVGANSTRVFTIKNTGGKSLNIGTISIDGSNSADFSVISSPSSSLAPGATTTFTVRFAPAAVGGRFAALHIANNVVGTTNPFDVNLAGRALTNSEAWRLRYFGTTDNSGAAADTANPTGDGLSNLLKYALNLNPLLPALNPTVVDKNSGYLRLTVTKNPNATDVNYIIQASSDLSNASGWTSSGVVIDQNTASLLQGHDATPITELGKRFIRLQVSRP